MNTITQIERWGDEHHPAWLDVVRIMLGIFLFLKGVSFISDTTQLKGIVEGLNVNLWTMAAVHYVAFAHLFGGILITIGCLTRIAVWFQIPVLFVAVFFANLSNGFSFLNSEFWLSFLTLILLVIFWVAGSGKFSFDGYVKSHPVNQMR
jgi:putative oxidoreductase